VYHYYYFRKHSLFRYPQHRVLGRSWPRVCRSHACCHVTIRACPPPAPRLFHPSSLLAIVRYICCLIIHSTTVQSRPRDVAVLYASGLPPSLLPDKVDQDQDQSYHQISRCPSSPDQKPPRRRLLLLLLRRPPSLPKLQRLPTGTSQPTPPAIPWP
jgi:hypothetical protein